MGDRVIIENITPRTPNGYPAKAVVGRPVTVAADVFRDGHDIIAARVRWRAADSGRPPGGRSPEGKWEVQPMTGVGNDRFEAVVTPSSLGAHEFIIEGWTDWLATWRHAVTVKLEAGQPVDVELEEGALLLEAAAERVSKADRERVRAAADGLRDAGAPIPGRLARAFDPVLVELLTEVPDPTDLARSETRPLWVDRERAQVGAWYELFPRSCGGLRGAAGQLHRVAGMGFDIVYLPPVHPIGRSFRKGRNNSPEPAPEDPGSPWAIGAEEGGHTALHPELGTFDDFDFLVAETRAAGMEVAIDYALQCSPEHPWLAEHPEWFHHRPDGTIKYAENPPKKYQDIYPLNMWPAPGPGVSPQQADADRQALWEACREILFFWIGHGIRIFRVDNPHTKPFAFWEWVIAEVQRQYPDVLFLAEAFTRPKVMARLAEVGFTQSYTYFTWRNTKAEFIEYLTEIAHGPKADYMRPNFWPNTPDILSGPLRDGPLGAFKLRLILAAMMTPSYGIYSGYELGENVPMSPTNEEYFESEKYEIKDRDFETPGNLGSFIAAVNDIRRRHPALQDLTNIQFHHSNNEWLLVWSKMTEERDDVILVVANLDPYHPHDDVIAIDLGLLGLPTDAPYEAYDELTGVTYVWNGPNPYVRLTPDQPAHVLHLRWMPAWEMS
ncbi:MAG: alpha-1,4-glucan--maltose-1-phosphate maltosyltransferase [Acidimicrobiia bacterium]